MSLYRPPLRTVLLRGANVVLMLVVFAATLIGASLFSRSTGQDTIEQQRQATEDAIRRAAVSCYSIEGVYPQKLSYLEEHYGLSVDYNRFSIEYQVIADNILPTVTVGVRGEDSF